MFKNIKIFKMFGVDIFLNITWFLIFFLCFTWQGTTIEIFISELVMVLTLFGTVLLHEFGHILAARKLGVGTDKVVLSVLGGAAFIDTEQQKKLTPKQNMWVYFAGPLVNIILLILSLISMVIYTINTGMTELDTISNVILLSIIINAIMLIFNLLPIFPMDGGGIFRNLLEHFKVKKSLLISARISQLLCIGLFCLSIILSAWVMCAISILFFFYAVAEIKKEKSSNGIIKMFGREINFNDD